MSASSQATAADVTLSTGVGTGGGIGTAATALNVDVERNFTFRPNGEFNVLLNGTGPSGLTAQVGVAPAALTYSGTLSRSGGALTLNASATDTTVMVSNLAVTSGFNQRVFNSTPFITLRVPNGALVASSVTVPEGDTNPTTISPPFTTATLPLSISSSGNLTVNSYTRQSTASSLAKTTSFQSDTGTITLGTINASKDTVTANAFGGSIAVSNLSSGGNVSVTSFAGDVTVDRIDTTSGTGSVSLNASFGAVKAQTDSVATEITSGSTIAITGQTIGASTFTNPLDMAGSAVTLTSQNSGGQIGFTGKPIVANTQTLTVNAASPTAFNVNTGATFNVSTGATALKNLTVFANPTAVGMGGLAQVSTEVGTGNAITYVFDNTDGASFTFNPGAIPSTQFASGILSFTSTNGNVTLGNINMGTGGLTVAAPNGSITGGANLDGSSLILNAGTGVAGAAASVTTGNIGANVRPNNVQMTSGNNGFGTSRSGSVTTGTIEAGALGITTFNGAINAGSVGATTRAGAVTLTSNNRFSGDAGQITAGNIRADSISISRAFNATVGSVTTGNLNTTGSVAINSDSAITTGALDASSISIGGTFCCNPAISTGAIGGATPPNTINMNGSTVTIGGTVTGNPSAADTINIQAFSGTLSINSGNTVVTGGDGSTISLTSSGAGVLEFSNINAGATGTVSVTSGAGIRQLGSGGITAKTVTLSATNAGADIDGDAATPTFGSLQLNSTKILTVNTFGSVALDANGSQLDTLSITTFGAGPDTNPVSLIDMGGSQSLTVSDLGNGDFNLALGSPSGSPLNFTFLAPNAGIRTTGGGIVTSGGNVRLQATGVSDVFDGTTGGITTAGGNVQITTFGTLTTGAINTGGSGGSITLSASTGNLVVNNSLNTGTGGGFIFLIARDSISGSGSVLSDAGVEAFTTNGDIGTSGTPLSITTPSATLSARGSTAGVGNVFAALTGTTTLNLTADNNFVVSSNTALNTLTLATEGSGTGTTLSLTAPGQTFSFARPTTDLFGTPITNTFRIVSASGTPLTNATFRASDGDLLIAGPATINATNLTLQASSTGDIKLQGNAPLTLNNTTQNIDTVRDLLITGNLTLSASGSQNISVIRDVTAQAQGGSVTLSSSNQTIQANTGTISFTGGAGADEKVTVSASNAQTIQTFQFSGGQDITLQAGAGDRASVTVSYTGTGTQVIQANNNVNVLGSTASTSTDSIAEITTATGSQFIAAEGNINLTGGAGSNATARIVNTGTGNQQVGESRFGFSAFPYQTNNITLQGGTGSGSFAEITAAGPQQIFATSGGTVNVLGGGGINAFARIESLSTSEQRIGFPSYFCCGFTMGSLSIQGGSGTGSYGRINAAGFQRVTDSTAMTVMGNAADASASLIGAGQDIRVGTTLVQGGTGNNAHALVQSTSTQFIDPSNVTLIGGGSASTTATAKITAAGLQQIFGSAISLTSGAGANSVAQITTTGDQTINFSSLALNAMNGGNGSFATIDAVTAGTTQSLSGGSLTMTAGGAGQTVEPFVAVPNANAIIEGHSQTIASGAMTLNGGAGASGSTSDAILRNLSGSQSVSASSITLNGGHTQSTTGILNLGAGTQTVSGNSGITLRSDPNLPPAHVDSFVLIQNPAATLQTITANNGGVTLANSGAGTVAVTSAGTQAVTSRFVDVTTSAGGTGNATLSSTGNQRIHTTNENATRGLRVAALGSGTANIESGASQLLEITYPEVMQTTGLTGAMVVGDINAAGISRVKAVDQSVFAGSIIVQSGGTGSLSELKASNVQTISTLTGGIDVLGGSGDNSLAQIDPLTQIILSNGTVDVVGGSGVNAIAQIVSGGVQVIVGTNGNITLTGGGGSNADALISTPGSLQTISTVGNITLTPGTGVGADASIINANGTVTAPFTSGPGSTLGVPLSSTLGGGGGGASSGADTAGDFGISQVLADQGNQTTVVGELAPPPEEFTEEGAPICR